jgi:hypothetical protein
MDCPGALPSDPDALNDYLDSLVSANRVSAQDADAVRQFRRFLEAVAPYRPGPLPVSVIREYQGYLGVSDVELAEIERQRRTDG